MVAEGAGLSDEVRVELNPTGSLPERPASSKSKEDWIEYVVALGADRIYVTGDTDHYSEDERYVTHPGLTKDELVDLADRLGG